MNRPFLRQLPDSGTGGAGNRKKRPLRSAEQSGMANLAEQGGVGCAFRVLAGDVQNALACLLCRYVWSKAWDSRRSLRRPWLHPGPRLSLLALVSRRKRRDLQRSCLDPHLAHGRPLFLPDRSHGCALHRLSTIRSRADSYSLHPPGFPGAGGLGFLTVIMSHHVYQHGLRNMIFGYGEKGGFAGDAEVKNLMR